MEKKNFNELLNLIREAGYKIKNIEVKYDTRYSVPHYIDLKICSPEYNEAVLNDNTRDDKRKRFYLDH